MTMLHLASCVSEKDWVVKLFRIVSFSCQDSESSKEMLPVWLVPIPSYNRRCHFTKAIFIVANAEQARKMCKNNLLKVKTTFVSSTFSLFKLLINSAGGSNQAVDVDTWLKGLQGSFAEAEIQITELLIKGHKVQG